MIKFYEIVRLITKVIILSIFIMSCVSTMTVSKSTLLPPISIRNGDIDKFKYIYINPTKSLTSSYGTAIGNQYYSSTKSINPSDIIVGVLSKKGLIIVPEIKPELIEETLVVNYGQSGRRDIGGGGYTTEVTIQFISAKTSSLICSCTAEGLGSTEADDIWQAITRCLTDLIDNKN
jgi:hypothetical protein